MKASPSNLLAEVVGCPNRVASTPVAIIPELLGELERVRAALWARMVAQEAQSGEEGDQGSLLTAKQAAEYLQVAVSWIYESARTGRLPSVKVGRYRRFRRGDLEQYREGTC